MRKKSAGPNRPQTALKIPLKTIKGAFIKQTNKDALLAELQGLIRISFGAYTTFKVKVAHSTQLRNN